MGLLEQFLLPTLTSFVGALIGWFFGKAKEKAELQTSELDNVDKAVKIYREMIEDLSEKYAKAIAELERANHRVKELEISVEELLAELKKYKQLNGKASG